MSFKTAAVTANNNKQVRTANGMRAKATSASPLVDLFNCIGSSRGTPVVVPFAAALAADEDKAIRILLWARDILQGAGERKQFRDLLSILEKEDYKLAGRLIPKLPELGRWDDLFYFEHPENKFKAFDLYSKALASGDALAAKWAPREKSANRKFAYEFRKHLGLKPKEYRKLLVEKTNVVENLMCANNWDEINYSHVPSIAAFRYQKAFTTHSPKAYSEYLNALNTGGTINGKAVKVNSKALYPHDIVKSIARGHTNVAQAQWDALPNFVGDNKILPMVDVSGSMGHLGYNSVSGAVQPIEVALALGLYLSEKNTSSFKDVFLTFTDKPEIKVLQGSLNSRLNQLSTASWGMNTDLNLAFDAILKLAVSSNLPHEEMPEFLLILSDMQFDRCVRNDDSAIEMIERKYAAAGYEVPNVVFWNLRSVTQDVAVSFDKRGTALVSGFSPAILTSILANDLGAFTPENVMLKTIMSDRYKV